MAVIDRVASKLGRNDEVPNQELARDLAARGATDEIAEIAAHLWDRDAAVRSDCIKVLDEIGSLNPALIAPYAEDFVRLLGDKQNRLVWGGMTALASIATITADTLYPHVAEIQAAMARGSVITVDQGVKTLAGIAAGSPERNAALFPLLLAHLETCRSKEVPQHAESTLVAVDATNRDAFVDVMHRRLPELTPPQAARIKRLVRRLNR
jgi:hypothetical protein